MSLSQSDTLPLRAPLPRADATVKQLDGSTVRVSELLGQKGTVFLFWSNRCPWVDRYEERVRRLIEDFQPSGIRFLRVNANNLGRTPEAAIDVCRQRAQEWNYQTPYVRDSGAALARALGASQTPQVFLFNAQRTLVYKGAIDDSPSDSDQVQQAYLEDALSRLLKGDTPSVQSTKPFGCTLKYPQ